MWLFTFHIFYFMKCLFQIFGHLKIIFSRFFGVVGRCFLYILVTSPLSRYIFYECFLLVFVLPINFFNWIFSWTELFNFDKVWFIIFSSYGLLTFFLYRETLPTSELWRYSLMFSSKVFIVITFTFRSMITFVFFKLLYWDKIVHTSIKLYIFNVCNMMSLEIIIHPWVCHSLCHKTAHHL